ncbi:hypothetical protein GQ600_16587 [Phytophthora cactorum]|nr:hypothetical protein GQ600_16587 [Phytophthora cactorum]
MHSLGEIACCHAPSDVSPDRLRMRLEAVQQQIRCWVYFHMTNAHGLCIQMDAAMHPRLRSVFFYPRIQPQSLMFLPISFGISLGQFRSSLLIWISQRILGKKQSFKQYCYTSIRSRLQDIDANTGLARYECVSDLVRHRVNIVFETISLRQALQYIVYSVLNHVL